MPPLATRLRHIRLRLPLAALVLSAMAFGGAPRGHAQAPTGPGSTAVAASGPASGVRSSPGAHGAARSPAWRAADDRSPRTSP